MMMKEEDLRMNPRRPKKKPKSNLMHENKEREFSWRRVEPFTSHHLSYYFKKKLLLMFFFCFFDQLNEWTFNHFSGLSTR